MGIYDESKSPLHKRLMRGAGERVSHYQLQRSLRKAEEKRLQRKAERTARVAYGREMARAYSQRAVRKERYRAALPYGGRGLKGRFAMAYERAYVPESQRKGHISEGVFLQGAIQWQSEESRSYCRA